MVETKRQSPRLVASWAIVLLAVSCARGPDYSRPNLGTDIPPQYAAESDTTGIVPPGAAIQPPANRWWTSFGDSNLDRLVDEALARNHTLSAAIARVLESRAILGGSSSARWPAIEVGGSATRSKFTRARFGGEGSIYNTLYETNATARYELDLWGRLSRAEEAARAGLIASEEDRRTIAQTLIADVVRTWTELEELDRQAELSERTIASFEKNLELVRERYRVGVSPSVDYHLAKQNLLAARAQLPEWYRQRDDVIRRLNILVGRYPSADPVGDRPFEGEPRPQIPPLPPGLPSDLLDRRPDVRAAEERLHAATAGVGEAKAALYPRINLTGSAGTTSAELADLIKQGASVWSLLGNVAMPLINRGALESQVEAAEARTTQALADYRSTVLNAFGEVESALAAERIHRERAELLRQSVTEARRSLSLAEDRYMRGLDNLLLTLDTQRRLYQSESELIRTERLYRTARVNLILALGGPWDETPDEDQGAAP